MREISIEFELIHEDAQVPAYAHASDSGMDVRSVEDYCLNPGEYRAISTGLKVNIPEGYELQVRPKSGLAANYGITVLNAPGTIDAGYEGEIKVVLINHGHDYFQVKVGGKIAQLVIAEVITAADRPALDAVVCAMRGTGGFGSTGY